MSYTPQTGDIGLTGIQGYVGRLIRLGQWFNGDGFHDYQHAFVMVSPGRLVEAMPEGARSRPLSQYHDVADKIRYLRCPAEHRERVAEAAEQLIGTPYSFADYLSLFLRRLKIPAPHLRSYIASSRHMICSQLADEAAKRGGWHLFDDGRWSGDVTPGDLYELYGRKWVQEDKSL